jgi:hypothetical protein
MSSSPTVRIRSIQLRHSSRATYWGLFRYSLCSFGGALSIAACRSAASLSHWGITDQGKAALRSLFELKGKTGSSVDLYFGPTALAGHEGEWIKTIPDKGWFVYFRIDGPKDAGLRRKLETGGSRVGEMSAFPLSLNDASDWPSTRWDYLR